MLTLSELILAFKNLSDTSTHLYYSILVIENLVIVKLFNKID